MNLLKGIYHEITFLRNRASANKSTGFFTKDIIPFSIRVDMYTVFSCIVSPLKRVFELVCFKDPCLRKIANIHGKIFSEQ